MCGSFRCQYRWIWFSSESPWTLALKLKKTSFSGLCHSVLPRQQQSPNNHSLSSFSNRPFRHRVLWNHDQILQLESWYLADRYPTGQAMRHYADALAAMCPTGASPTRQNVDYWFQNRRRKDSHPEVLQQREKKKLAKTLWGNILDQRAGHSGSW